ncbi:WD repeat-containing and planar cell polarity effector protein fritz homolog isoform X1 [Myxocyprinus asiaticus]|uniref:WD repeat-containing and planar cell polarity effector protein fritz homolog isoform X1 n=1 Tax=Myxocyprinus asiaticus TaxID=70543 RepID=UPI002221BAA6|nr:WD repeat-containing and planar cell polarity effector protein fritz homolog isoform X1 [Myxocyprinus asiaticus]XP_051501762.1 WD repeat-containing and planar cell polarity effector protein fritz homolog isoform X1 [Myxocyprinus asiaticus]XP_051501763.1 WD repeat-containing and planar cell polarity effector protein fritz homolog isoform X1 [Myxocyprinus asiaticus]
MSFCLAELHLWSFRSSLQVEDRDIGTYQFYDKGEPASPTDQHYYNEKQQFAESRGYPWFLSNRRPEKLRDALKELEEQLQSSTVLSVRWRTKQCCQMLLRSGVLVTLILGGAQVERVTIDRTLVGRLPADTISDAVIGDRILLFSMKERSQMCQVYLNRKNQSSPELKRHREKLTATEIKVSVVDLPGGGRRVERRVGLNQAQDVALCWWPLCNEEVRPWSPAPSATDRANLVLLACSDTSGFTILSTIRTDGNPIDCRFSLMQPYHVLTVELHQEARNSTSEVHEEAQPPEVQTSVYECARGRLQHLSSTPLPLPSKPITCSRDPLERWVLLGLQDCSVVLFDPQTGLSQWATCSMVPSLLAWHPSGALLMVGGGQGELQCFDMGLSPLPLRIVSEEQSPGSVGPGLQLSHHMKTSGGLEGMQWAYCPISQGSDGMEAHDLLMLCFHGGPLAALRLRLGVLNGAQLGPGDLVQHRLRCGEVNEALSILGNMDWAMMGAECFRSLISITDHLLRRPLDHQTEGQLEAALGVFYAPTRPLSNTVILEYRDPISRYARRFFHHLLRHQRFEKAFLLAVDIGARDLFMDLHYVAADKGEVVLAAVAKKKANEIDAETQTSAPDECQSVNGGQSGVSFSSVPDTHTERKLQAAVNENDAHDPKNWCAASRCVFMSGSRAGEMLTSEVKDDLSNTLIGHRTCPWKHTEINLVDRDTQVPEEGKLKVIHFGLV